MRSLGSWLIIFFLIMFWVFRIIVAVTGQMGVDFVTKPINVNVEIALLFVVLVCILFILKRNLIGALGCLIAYGGYFGPTLLKNIILVFEGQNTNLDIYLEILIGAIAIILSVVAVFDILIEKSKKKNSIDKQTDWFYKNEAYDRKLDERADKNQYRTGL